MQITREYIQRHMLTIEKQIAAYQGAYQLCEQMLRDFDKPEDELTVNDFAEMVGGPGARATVEAQDN